MPRLFCIAIFMICVFNHSAAQQWVLPQGLAREMAIQDALQQEDHETAFRILTGYNADTNLVQFSTYQDLLSNLKINELVVLSLWGRDKVYVTLAAKDKEFCIKSLSVRKLSDIVDEYKSLQNKPSVLKNRLKVVSDELLHFLNLDLSLVEHLIIIGNNPFTDISWGSFPDKNGDWIAKGVLVRISPSLSQAFPENVNTQPGHLVYGLVPREGIHDAINSVHSQFGGRMDRGDAASWPNYKAFAPLANFIHLEQACMTDGKSPALDRIIFSDTLLPLDGLQEVRVSARMAVIKGSCSGHTVLAASHAFAQAGCPSLIGNLWEVQGKANEQILTQCYINIKKGYPFDKALQKAQLAYLDTAPEDQKQPYYWAGLVLSGAPGKAESSGLGWFILFAGLVVIPLLWTAWKRQR